MSKGWAAGRRLVVAMCRVNRRAIISTLALALAGCGGSALDSYSLTAPREGLSGRASTRQMVITEPVAGSPYDGERIVVRTGPEAVAYLKGAQWVERLPRMIQTTMIQAFENARFLRSVGRPGDRFTAEVSLNSEIRRFEIDVTTNEAVVEISAKMVSEGNGRIIAARIFTTKLPGSASDGRVASAALDEALDRTLREIVAWAAASG